MAYTTIDKHSSHFEISQWAGDGGTQNITNHNFQPDRILLKSRATGDGWSLQDSVRGFGSTTKLSPYDTSGPNDSSGGSWGNYGYLSQALTNGFTTVAGSNPGQNNKSGNNYVGYSQLAGGTAPTQTYTVKVVSDSGNKYRFDDFGTSAVTLDLQEGGTYTFDSSDSTVNSHPFVLGTSSGVDGSYTTGVTYKLDGVTKTYSQYTSGFSSATSRQLIITVAASAPTLYYNCSVHSGMGGAINTNDTTGSSNFAGSIQSKISTNSISGFSIVQWTGTGSTATIGHELGSKPELIIIKNLDSTTDWRVFHHKIPGTLGTRSVRLNNTDYYNSDNSHFNDTAPGNSVITLGSSTSTNGNGTRYVAYCYKGITGYSSFGSYVGNGNADGAFIYTGFKPAFFIFKRIDGGTENWAFADEARNYANVSNHTLAANSANAESGFGTGVNVFGSGNKIDILSNGIKIREASNYNNTQGATYLYIAFGQTLVGSNNVPATAR